MTSLTAEERAIVEQLEARTRDMMEGLSLRHPQSQYTKAMLEHFTAQNKAYKIALESVNEVDALPQGEAAENGEDE